MQPICTFKQFQIFALTVAGLSLVSILITLFVFNYPSFAKTRVINALVFKNDSDSMIRFETTADLKNLKLSFYVYNITNPDEVKKGDKINLKELGPFVYSEFKSRSFINNDQIAGLITYNLTKRFVFDREASVDDPTKLNITWFNIPLLAISKTINELPALYRIPAHMGIEAILPNLVGEKAFIEDSIHNLLIGGSFRPIFERIEPIMKIANIKSPLINDTFGLLFGKNNIAFNHALTTSAGFGTGQTYHELNQYVAMDGNKTLNIWKDEPKGCNRIGGTDGEFFSPFLDRNENLEIFPLDLCRKLSLTYKTNVTMLGVHTWQYVLDPKTLQSFKNNLANKCYCLAKDPSDPECNLDGLIDLQKCNGQMNVYASGAHFWAGSDNLTRGFTGDGLTKDASLHEPTFLVEPSTGLALKVHVPLQFNVKLDKYKANRDFKMFKFLENLEEPIFLPFAWVIEASEMTKEQSDQLKKELLIFDTWLITMVLGGSIILIVAIIVAAVILCLKLNNPNIRVESETDRLMRTNQRSYST